MLGLQNAKPTATPDQGSERDTLSPPLDADESAKFRKATGILLYFSFDRPDIQRSTMMSAKRLRQPLECDMVRLKRVVRYLKGKPDMGQWLPKPDNDPGVVVIDGWVDTDWAADPETRKSVTGQIIDIDGCPMASKVGQQSLLGQSSGESEFIGMHSVACDMVMFRNLYGWLGFRVEWRLLSDSAAAKGMACRRGVGKVRHLDIRTLYIQELVHNCNLRIIKVKGAVNKADLGTKSHPEAKFAELLKLNGITDGTDFADEAVTCAAVKEVNSALSASELKQALMILITAITFRGGAATNAIIPFSSPSISTFTCDARYCRVAAEFEILTAVMTILTVFALVWGCKVVYFRTCEREQILLNRLSACEQAAQHAAIYYAPRSKASKKSVRTIGTMSPCTYKFKYSTPRFVPLPEHGHGATVDDIQVV